MSNKSTTSYLKAKYLYKVTFDCEVYDGFFHKFFIVDSVEDLFSQGLVSGDEVKAIERVVAKEMFTVFDRGGK